MVKLNIEGVDTFLEGRDSAIARDLKLNLKRILGEGALAADEAALALLATATSVGSEELAQFARIRLKELDFTEEKIREAGESAAIMAMLNTYYRFKHMLTHHNAEAATHYRSAGLRMTGLANPSLGKLKFEMLAFAVSVLNGCETCITSHEKALRDGGVESDKIHDLARLAAVVKGCETLTRAA